MELAIVLVVLVATGTAVSVAAVRARTRRAAAGATAASRLAELQREAGSALVRADERIRLADDELGFAVAEFGDASVADFAAAVQRAKQRLAEAFHLNQQISDAVPESDEQRQAWAERIIALCGSAESGLREQSQALAERRAAARRTPAELERVRGEIARVRAGVPEGKGTLARLADRYADSALAPIATNVEQADSLLTFAGHSLQVAETRLAAGRDAEADKVVTAAAETVRRAEALLQAVDAFEVEALQAESTLAAMVAESRAELAEARALPMVDRSARIDAAAAALEQALAALPLPGADTDPVASLTAVRQANTALDLAVAERAQRAERKERLRSQLVTAIDDAERQLAAARELVSDYRAPIGPDARTRLAEADRELAEMTEERDPERAVVRARRAASLAADAAAFARADLAAGQRQAGAARSPGFTGPQVLGGVLGGLVIGGLLDDIGDLGDFGDFFH